MDAIDPSRVRVMNAPEPREGDCILYWMHASPRAECNHALEYAIRKAIARNKPLLALFCLTPAYPNANLRHYTFLLDGLEETFEALQARGISTRLRSCMDPPACLAGEAKRADMVIADMGYTRISRAWLERAAQMIDVPLVRVESNVVVPVEIASKKEEWSAATMRRRLLPAIERHLVAAEGHDGSRIPSSSRWEAEEIPERGSLLSELGVDRSVPPVEGVRGGTQAAKRELARFISERLEMYGERRSDPSAPVLSNMSPYLHFGQISPVQIAREVLSSGRRGTEAYMEELIVRRELAVNFVYHNTHYDEFECLPNWAQVTLLAHAKDERPHLYSLEELESAKTHDRFWNAAQREMVKRGKMHGYMRMYWGKKILEWTESPEEAFRRAIYLNDKYELDGRDPNGYAGIAWCFGKHDRPWKERPIFGKVRYMSAEGLARKFDMEAYLEAVG